MSDIRVLHFGYSANLGGVETVIKNIALNSHIPCDILVTSQNEVPFEKELIENGCNIIRIPPRRENPLAYKKNIKKLLIEHTEYKIIHVHLNTASSIEPVIVAHSLGRKVVAHSHSTNASFNKLTKVLHTVNKTRLSKLADIGVACSEQAGKYLFNKDFIVIPNGVDVDKFKYNKQNRAEIRKELGFTDEDFVVINVGMLYSVKNQVFLIDAFKDVLKTRQNAKLLLVGEGADREMLTNRIKANGLENSVTLMGKCLYVDKLYCGADAFALPSLFEGYPITLIEALVSGLKCLVSENVPVVNSNNVEYLPLEHNLWVDKICSIEIGYHREACDSSQYDVNSMISKINKLYDSLL